MQQTRARKKFRCGAKAKGAFDLKCQQWSASRDDWHHFSSSLSKSEPYSRADATLLLDNRVSHSLAMSSPGLLRNAAAKCSTASFVLPCLTRSIPRFSCASL